MTPFLLIQPSFFRPSFLGQVFFGQTLSAKLYRPNFFGRINPKLFATKNYFVWKNLISMFREKFGQIKPKKSLIKRIFCSLLGLIWPNLAEWVWPKKTLSRKTLSKKLWPKITLAELSAVGQIVYKSHVGPEKRRDSISIRGCMMFSNGNSSWRSIFSVATMRGAHHVVVV